MPKKFNINDIIDPIKKKILGSPLGRLLSDDIGLMQYTDRNSGKTLTHAVVLDQCKGFYWLVKDKTDSFWRNFQGGSPVVVKFKGNDYKGWAELTKDPDIVRTVFTNIISEPRHSTDILDKDLDLSDTSEDIRMFTKKFQILIVHAKAAL